ncbi:hypothetical protein CRENBAI_004639 [Crenichthys baileyi]|uniref:Uncharacterized protein n=1 Tax=Crenichthys baileyi TaxID=28760 RepID=A0AAV9S2B9_9TELE
MAGLDGLIGAEERIINSKPKMGENMIGRLINRDIDYLCHLPFLIYTLHSPIYTTITTSTRFHLIPKT